MADRQPRKRKPPTCFNDFEAVELINDSEADLTSVDLDDDALQTRAFTLTASRHFIKPDFLFFSLNS